MDRTERWIGITCVLLLATIISGVSTVCVLMSWVQDPVRVAFDSESWKDQSGEGYWSTNSRRWRMHDDLLRRYDLRGKSREFVEQLLGPADLPSASEGWYDIGGGAGWGPSAVFLKVQYKNGTVGSYRVQEED